MSDAGPGRGAGIGERDHEHAALGADEGPGVGLGDLVDGRRRVLERESLPGSGPEPLDRGTAAAAFDGHELGLQVLRPCWGGAPGYSVVAELVGVTLAGGTRSRIA